VVLTDDYDPLLIDAFRSQPPELSPIQAFRAAMIEAMSQIPPDEWERERARHELTLSLPELRSAMLDEFIRSFHLMASLVAERVGREADDFAVRSFCGALMGATMAAGLSWAADTERQDYVKLLDDTLAHLEAGL